MVPVTPDQILAIAGNANKLRSFVMSGNISAAIADSQLRAAKDAFEKASSANDPKAQVWSAINHLESAFHIYEGVYKGKGKFYDSMYTRIQMGTAGQKNRFVLFLLAICYYSVGEEKLASLALEKANNTFDVGYDDQPAPWISFVTAVYQVFDPRTIYTAATEEKPIEVNKKHLEELANYFMIGQE